MAVSKKIIVIAVVIIIAVIAIAAVVLLSGGAKVNPEQTVEISGSDVSVNDVQSALNNLSSVENGTLEIVIKDTTSSNFSTVNLEKGIVSKLASAGASLVVSTPNGEVDMSNKDLAGLGDQKLTLTVGIEPKTAAAVSALEDKYASWVSSVIKVGVKTTSDVTLKENADFIVKYTLKSTESADKINLWYLSGTEVKEKSTQYKDGNVIVSANHTETYYLTFKTIEDVESNTVENALLKVFGNVNGDNTIDSKDVDQLTKIISEGATIAQYPIADANQDGKIDSKDLDVVKAIVNWKAGDAQVQIYHINYHDTIQNGDSSTGDGVMDLEIVSTMYPITSTIMSGSANIGMLMQMLGIIDEVKGAAYSSTSLDKTLYKYNYLDTSKVEKIGTSATTIKFEDGKIGSSEIIATKNVTALITDWNRTYITNEQAFEEGHVDVVRVASSACDKSTYTHSILMLGFLFQKQAAAEKLVSLYDECFEMVQKYAGDGSLAGLAASMNGYFSSSDSDYTQVLLEAGLKFGLEGYDFGGSSALKTADHLDVWDTDLHHFDYIVHIRTAVDYGGTITNSTVVSYANSFDLWEYTMGEHQYILSGAIPVPLRILYTESIFNTSLAKGTIDALHQRFINEFFDNKNFDATAIDFFINCADYFGEPDTSGAIKNVEDAVLKVFGNVNGDDKIDDADYKLLDALIRKNASANDYPIADANQDGKIDAQDKSVLTKIISGGETVVWHVNYHDIIQNGDSNTGDGIMDMEIVSTKYPVNSVLISGSANVGMLLQMMGIVDEVKGAAYSSTSLDKTLYATSYLDTTKVEKVGSSAMTIPFEDGKVGSSDIIARENVTAIVSDWNRTYIPNENSFRASGIDVIRISASALDRDTYAHSILLLGLLFQKEDTANKLLALYDQCFDLTDKNLVPGDKKGVAASMNGYLSSADSDYTAILLRAGLEFGLEGYDFGGTTSLKTADHLDVWDTDKYHFDYIIHVRTAVGYGTVDDATLKKYSDSFDLWEYKNGQNQYVLSGAIPVPLRALYLESALNNTLDKATIDALHQTFIDQFFYNKNFKATDLQCIVDCSTLY